MGALPKSIDSWPNQPVENQDMCGDAFGDASGGYVLSGCWREQRLPRTYPSRVGSTPPTENEFGDL